MARSILNQFAVFTGFTRNDCADFVTVQILLSAIRSDQERQQNKAIKCLYSRFETIAYAEARRFGKNRQEAADPMNNVLISLYQRIQERNLTFLTEEEMAQYVRKSLFYQFRKTWVREKKIDYYGESGQLAETEHLMLDSDFNRVADAERVKLALAHSTSECREKLLLAQEGHSYEEIGILLQITANSAKNAVFRCRERLKKLFREFDNKPIS